MLQAPCKRARKTDHNATPLQDCLCHRERGEPIPADQSLDIARRIKERYCYIAADMVKV